MAHAETLFVSLDDLLSYKTQVPASHQECGVTFLDESAASGSEGYSLLRLCSCLDLLGRQGEQVTSWLGP